MAWGKNGTPETLSSSDDTVTITDMTKRKHNEFLGHTINISGTINYDVKVGNGSVDNGANYTERGAIDGAADSTYTSVNELGTGWDGVSYDTFSIYSSSNVDGEEKLFIHHFGGGTAGAANAPQRREAGGKWVTTSGQYDHFEIEDSGAGTFDTDSNVSALGTD